MKEGFYKLSPLWWLKQIFYRIIPTGKLVEHSKPILVCDEQIRGAYTPLLMQNINFNWPMRRHIKKCREAPVVLNKPDRSRKLAVIIPFRHRESHLEQLAPALHKVLNEQGIHFQLFVIEQADDGTPFNRGMVCNIGFDFTKEDFDYFCFHDVDMIPEVSDYGFMSQPIILSNHRIDEHGIDHRYPEENYFGGVVLFSKENYLVVNGFSNKYHGWGSEDNDLALRCVYSHLTPCRLEKGRYNLLPHPKSVTQTPDGQYHQDQNILKRLNKNVHQNSTRAKMMRRGCIDYKREGLNALSYTVILKETFPLYQKIKVQF